MKRFVALAAACAAILAVIAVPIASAHGPGDKAKRRSDATHKSTERTGRNRATCPNGDHLCGLDTEYLKESMEGDLFEIAGGKLAVRKSTNPAVLSLARALIEDHQKSYSDAAALARRLGVQVQTEPSPTEQWQLEALQQFTGAQFNHQYALLEVYDHEQDIDLAKHEAGDGCATAVRDNARDELPTLERHLAHSKQALSANP